MTAFPSPEAAEQVRAHKRPTFGAGAGYVQKWTGERLSMAGALQELARHLADAKNPNATESEVRHAVRCRQQLEAAIAASFPDQKEPQR